MQQRIRFLVACDLDGTLIPAVDTPRGRRAVSRFRGAMNAVGDAVALAYVTGRDLALAESGLESWGLPVPDFLVCDVGTSVYQRRGKDLTLDQGYVSLLRDAWGGLDASDLVGALTGIRGLEAQAEERQGRFKASFTFPWAERGTVEEEVARRLAETGAPSEVVVSFDPVGGHGLLDVLPAGGAKDRAVSYLGGVLGLSKSQVVFAGDSGNDRGALLSGVRAIVVGNATPELREDLREALRLQGARATLYLAVGDGAEGVVEGLAHWGVIPR